LIISAPLALLTAALLLLRPLFVVLVLLILLALPGLSAIEARLIRRVAGAL